MIFSGFYTGWLLPAAVVGVLVFLYGVVTMNTNTIAVETCHHGDQFNMCPLCEECDQWKLSDICLYKRISYLFDHPGTVFYAIFMSFWGKQSSLTLYTLFPFIKYATHNANLREPFDIGKLCLRLHFFVFIHKSSSCDKARFWFM